jgi:3',5'-cyclic AMP phosphodiesterase CpdA
MKKAIRYIALAFIVLVVSCDLDGWGWLFSSDVDDRYADNQGLPAPTYTGPALTLPFSFVVIADTHIYPGNDTSGRFTSLRNAIASNGDSFVLCCGDIVQNGALADFQTYRALTLTLGVPVYSVPGNHDLYCGGWSNYKTVLQSPSMYSFSTTVGAGSDTLRVIALDSANGTLGGPQRAWLESVLAAKTETYCFTFTHMQFFSDNLNETQQWTDINEAYSLMHLFETRGVNIHFSGHTHRYFTRTINGTNYLTVPGFASGFVRVTVDAAGAVGYAVIYF